MTRLRDALGRAAWIAAGSFAVVGEAGIGKSRLVEELIAHAQRREARVLLGRAYESDQILLFGPIVDALRKVRSTVTTRSSMRWTRPARRACSPAAEVATRRCASVPAKVDYRRLFEAIAALMAGLAARDPVLLVLEDLHWADELTLRLLAYLARRAPTERRARRDHRARGGASRRPAAAPDARGSRPGRAAR